MVGQSFGFVVGIEWEGILEVGPSEADIVVGADLSFGVDIVLGDIPGEASEYFEGGLSYKATCWVGILEEEVYGFVGGMGRCW